MAPELSLIVPYRNRLEHLTSLLEWNAAQDHRIWEIILVEASAQPTVESVVVSAPGCRYEFVECSGTFHLAKARNRGLECAAAEFVIPYDVDLLPVGVTIHNQARVAMQCPEVVFAGYRLMTDRPRVAPCDIDDALCLAGLAEEDNAVSVRQQLVERQRFGVAPILSRSRLEEIGGWDERYVGWGAEDQDMLERYLSNGNVLVRSPQFLYLHLAHGQQDDWNEPHHRERNRSYYEERRRSGFRARE